MAKTGLIVTKAGLIAAKTGLIRDQIRKNIDFDPQFAPPQFTPPQIRFHPDPITSSNCSTQLFYLSRIVTNIIMTLFQIGLVKTHGVV